jgi:hypothetical protein
LQLELEPPLLAVLALLGERRAPGAVRQEPGVAAPAAAAGGGQPAVAVVEQVGEHLAGVQVLDHRALGDGDLESDSPRLPCRSLPLPCTPLVGAPVRVVAEGQQRGHVAVGDQPDVAALAAVATVGTAVDDGASRRNDTQPAPPSPPRTFSWHSSTNCRHRDSEAIAAVTPPATRVVPVRS